MSDTHLSGPMNLTGLQTIATSGAVDVITPTTEITTTGTGDAFTLADGSQGLMKTIVYSAEGGGADTAVLTPANLAGGATITFTDVGAAVELCFSGGTWYIAGSNDVVVA